MNTTLRDQLRNFAEAYSATLPEIDADEILTNNLGPQRAAGEPRRRASSAKRSVARGVLIASAVALGILALAIAPLALLSNNPVAETGPSAPVSAPQEIEKPANTQDSDVPALEWQEASTPDGFNVHAIVAIEGQFIGLAREDFASDNPRTRLWTSEDGISWDAIDIDASRFGMRAAYFQELTAVADTKVGIVKGELLDSGAIALVVVASTDGIAWDPVSIGDSESIPVAVAGNASGGVVLTRLSEGSFDMYDAWHSTDGSTWVYATTQSFPGVSGPVLVSSNNSFYLGAAEWVPDGEAQPAIWESTDASNWTPTRIPLGSDWAGWAIPAGADERLFVSTGNASDAQLWTGSTDAGWTELTLPGYEGGTVLDNSRDPTVVIGNGQSMMEDNTDSSTTSALWLSSDTGWTRYSPEELFGAPGSIGAAASNGEISVLMYAEQPDMTAVVWVGSSG